MIKNTIFSAILITFVFNISVAQRAENPIPVLSAETYLVSQFNKNEVIFLGELHRIKEQVEFVGNMIHTLHKNGINLLFSEFARFRDTWRIDSLVTAPVFDRRLAEKIMFDDSWDWGYKEYTDLYYAAWKTNQSRKPHEKPFRIIGMEDYDNEFNGLYDQEQFWAHLIDSIGIKKGEKALVYCGMHHAFTAYQQPYIVNDTLKGFVGGRVGNLLYKRYPGKTITILMHGPWDWHGYSYSESALPGNGQMDSLLLTIPESVKGLGFSTAGSTMGNLSLGNTSYGIGYPDIKLKDLCQGYIIVKPICKLHPVTFIPGFINESNLEETIRRAELGNLTPGAFNDTIQSWLYKYSTKNLKMMQEKFCY
jgi:hypothetical protein